MQQGKMSMILQIVCQNISHHIIIRALSSLQLMRHSKLASHHFPSMHETKKNNLHRWRDQKNYKSSNSSSSAINLIKG